jgi:chemotaxis methyl-accepting protein methylase
MAGRHLRPDRPSEVLYYLDADERARLLKRVLGTLMTHGHLVAVHEEEDFLLDVFAFAPDEADRQTLSVAAVEGLV